MSNLQITNPTKNPELVKVDTALTVLSQVNLLAESNALALDIGGSLAKLIYLQPHIPSKPTPPPLKIHLVDGSVATALSVRVPVLQGTLHFFAFETRNIHKLLRFIREHWVHSNPPRRQIRATGGGAYKYADTFQEEIDVTLTRLDEMKCTVAGLNFLLTSVDNEVYIYNAPSTPRTISPTLPNLARARRFVDSNQRPFPYLLVNIGSGVSIVKVTDHGCFERISGSTLGGGTFWGLARLLLNCKTFDDIINLTHTGNNENVDMLVGDIYGGSYSSLGLDASIIAASFGKATMRDVYSRNSQTMWSHMRHRFARAVSGTSHLWLSFLSSVPILGRLFYFIGLVDELDPPPMLTTTEGDQFRPQDVALSLLRMVSYNIGQIAHLNARVHGLDRIYFGGNFIRNHPFTIADISFSVDFWSNGKMKALFLRHDGYLGAIGAFIGASSAAPTKIMQLQESDQTQKAQNSEVPRKIKVEKVDGNVVPKNDTAKFGENERAANCFSKSQTNTTEVTESSIEISDAHPTREVDDISMLNGNTGQSENDSSDSIETIKMLHCGQEPSDVVANHSSKQKNPENGKLARSQSSEKISASTNAQPKGKRRRGGAKNRMHGSGEKGGTRLSEETIAKVSEGAVAVGGGTVIPEDEVDGGEWTTVRIRRRGGIKDKAPE